MRIEELPIPEQVKEVILKSGISVLYPPQGDAIKSGALEGKNLVLASPTASGKTLIAELCAMKHVIERGGKVLYLTPLRALASEKYSSFRKYEGLKKGGGRRVRVAISTGDYDRSDYWLSRFDVIVVTNEKCDSLLRQKADWIGQVTLVVADEVHLLNDRDRGPTLEVILTRLREINPNIQLLVLSATIRNADEIAEWLKADSITTAWRPVKLIEGVFLDNECLFNDGSTMKITEENGKNPVINLAIHEVKKGGQVLIFTETRRSAVSCAKRAAPIVRKCLSDSEKQVLTSVAERILVAGEKTRISDLLSQLSESGVAYHHAGLSCLPADTLITLWSGKQKQIDSLRPGDYVVSLNLRTMSFEKGKVLSTWQSGLRKIFSIKTLSGRQITASSNHPFLCLRNGEILWIPLKQLKIGEFLATPRILNCEDSRYRKRDIYWDKVRDITECGEADVWDLQVDMKNFIAENIIVHNSAQRKIIEDSFREGRLKVISATPTLAFGVNLPARMVVIRSYKRYEVGYGRYPIPVLEYKQMAGRAGRPQYDAYGEAILISNTGDEQDFLMQNYVLAEPERLWSKLAVEKALRSHVLASIASGFTHSEEGLFEFFSKTFYAHQYGSDIIQPLVERALLFLDKENMITFMGKTIESTDFGRRVSQLYIDPVSAVILRNGLNRRPPILTDLSFLHLVCHTPDMYPNYYPRRREIVELNNYVIIHSDELMTPIPDEGERVDYEAFLGEIKRARVLKAWTEEVSEDEIIERYSFQSGDLFRLISNADWLLYAFSELGRLFDNRDLMPMVSNLRMRISKGVKKELLPIIKLDGIGRVRGRILFNAGFKTIKDLRLASINQLSSLPLIGLGVARKIKVQISDL